MAKQAQKDELDPMSHSTSIKSYSWNKLLLMTVAVDTETGGKPFDTLYTLHPVDSKQLISLDVVQPPTTHVSLANLGIEQELEKAIGPLGIISVGYNICNSWVGLAATLIVSL